MKNLGIRSRTLKTAWRCSDLCETRKGWSASAKASGACGRTRRGFAGGSAEDRRQWEIRYNEQGPDGLINIPSPGAPPKLDDTHKAFLRRIVEEGPIPAVHGVVRWRACDLIVRLHEEFGLSVSDET